MAPNLEHPRLEPGEHSHRCPTCGHIWKHEGVPLFDLLLSDRPWPKHDCECCGTDQTIKFLSRDKDGMLWQVTGGAQEWERITHETACHI